MADAYAFSEPPSFKCRGEARLNVRLETTHGFLIGHQPIQGIKAMDDSRRPMTELEESMIRTVYLFQRAREIEDICEECNQAIVDAAKRALTSLSYQKTSQEHEPVHYKIIVFWAQRIRWAGYDLC